MSIFGFKEKKLENEVEVLKMKLFMAENRLRQYDKLMKDLKKHDWFEFNSGGGIVAHDANEPKSDFASYGHGYVVPAEVVRMIFS